MCTGIWDNRDLQKANESFVYSPSCWSVQLHGVLRMMCVCGYQSCRGIFWTPRQDLGLKVDYLYGTRSAEGYFPSGLDYLPT